MLELQGNSWQGLPYRLVQVETGDDGCSVSGFLIDRRMGDDAPMLGLVSGQVTRSMGTGDEPTTAWTFWEEGAADDLFAAVAALFPGGSANVAPAELAEVARALLVSISTLEDAVRFHHDAEDPRTFCFDADHAGRFFAGEAEIFIFRTDDEDEVAEQARERGLNLLLFDSEEERLRPVHEVQGGS